MLYKYSYSKCYKFKNYNGFFGLENVDLNKSDVTLRDGSMSGRYIQMVGNTSFDSVDVRSFILSPYGNNVFSNCEFSSGTRADNLKEDMDFITAFAMDL